MAPLPPPADKNPNNQPKSTPRPSIGPPSIGKPGERPGLPGAAAAGAATDSSLIPPEDTIWQKYAANGEPVVSGLASFLIHIAFPAVIFVLAILISRKPSPAVEEIEPVEIGNGEIGGGGGNPEGSTLAPGNLSRPKDDTASLDQPKPDKTAKLPEDDPTVKKVTGPTINDDPLAAAFVEKMKNKPNQANLGPILKDALEGLAGKGLGGSGRGGGEGTGVGKGRGSGEGDGTGITNRRGRRNLRWDLFFGVSEARQYLAQTEACGMILAVPDKSARIMLIRDTKKRPVTPEYEDVKALKRNWFIDDRRESCVTVSDELGLEIVPSTLIFFYPYEFEQELLKKELAFANKKEEEINYTKFNITFSGGKPVIRVAQQR